MIRGMSSQTGSAIDDIDHIRQSVRDILTTPIGSRVMRRDYGSLLPELIDRPLNGATLLQAYAATVDALVRWERRIRATRIQFDVDGGQLTIRMEAVRTDGPSAGRANTLTIPLRGAA